MTGSYPIENVRDTLDWLANRKTFSTFDLKDGFFQVKPEDESKPLTTIRTGLVHYNRLPQGLKNSPGKLQRIVNAILGDRKRRGVMYIMDDTIVDTETEHAHSKALESILDILIAVIVTLKLAKCRFGVRSTEI